MKQHRLPIVLAAALIGVTAAAFSPTVLETTSIVAEAATYNGFEYTVSSEAVTITGYTGTATNITIPSKINGKKVTAIDNNAFCPEFRGTYSPKRIYSVTIPSSVKSIGLQAFYKVPLKTLVIQGQTVIGQDAFSECTSLQNVQLDKVCTTDVNTSPFSDCSSLKTMNGQPIFKTIPDGGDYSYPIITANQNTRRNLKNLFINSNARFITDYAAALCEYVVDTETRSWMSDAVKARQLHDWIVNHREYEDEKTDGGISSGCGLFLSYGLDSRTQGVGEAICGGFSHAYTALLTQAGIESYVVHAGPTSFGQSLNVKAHYWNLIKADDKYYQVDVTADDGGSTDSYISYKYFLKSKYEMEHECHCAINKNGEMEAIFKPASLDSILEAALLNYNSALSYNYTIETGRAGLNQCVSYRAYDADADGIMDGDFDFNGKVNWVDNLILQQIGRGDMTLDGTVTELDNRLFAEFCKVGNHDYWLKICLQNKIFGL